MGFLRVLGKFLISAGVGVLLFVAWVLWGTGIYTSQQQDLLIGRLEESFVRPQQPDDEGPGKPPKGFTRSLDPGDPVFLLDIPQIAERPFAVVEGVDIEDLRKGPGHYPQCRPGFVKPLCTEFPEAWPGENGRVIVSGHRTTYGAPFYRLNELKKGDDIKVRTEWGEFVYRVSETRVVLPTSPAIVVQKQNTAELVLTTCNPRFSAAQRLIVFASLVEEAAR